VDGVSGSVEDASVVHREGDSAATAGAVASVDDEVEVEELDSVVEEEEWLEEEVEEPLPLPLVCHCQRPYSFKYSPTFSAWTRTYFSNSESPVRKTRALPKDL
jgi:hypothetical protein